MRVAAAASLGVCWVLTSFTLECPPAPDWSRAMRVQARKTHLSFARQLAWNVLRSMRANPGLPVCVLTSMSRSAVRALLADVPGFAEHAELVASRLLVAQVPCAEPLEPLPLPSPLPAEHPRAPRAPARCAEQCALAHAYLPALRAESAATKSWRTALVTAAITRHSRLTSVRATAHVPFETTLVLDADIGLCAHAAAALAGAAEELERRGKAVGVRWLAGHSTGFKGVFARFERCDGACAAAAPGGNATSTAAAVRAYMRCATGCAADLGEGVRIGCPANTGVLVVRRSAQAVALAATWYRRWYAQLVGRAPPPGLRAGQSLYSGDQLTFGSARLPRGQWAEACAPIANVPLNFHLGRPEVAVGQKQLRGPPIAVHDCKQRGRDGSTCASYDACCSHPAAGRTCVQSAAETAS